MLKLKTCPFCGGNALLSHLSNEYNKIIDAALEAAERAEMALANTREQLLMSVSARCTKYHIQDCLNCNDVECGDNMNPLKSKIQSLREALQWAMGFPKCTCYDPDNRGQEQTCNCGHAANVQKALATLEAAKKI